MENFLSWFHSLKNTNQIDEIILRLLNDFKKFLIEILDWFILLSTNQKIIILLILITIGLTGKFLIFYLKKYLKMKSMKRNNIFKIGKNEKKNSIYNPKEFRSKK